MATKPVLIAMSVARVVTVCSVSAPPEVKMYSTGAPNPKFLWSFGSEVRI
jgi:hypothetical protein